MIVRVRRGSAPREEYLALQLTESGEWIALTIEPDPSADQAIRRCADGIQRQLTLLQQDTNRKLGVMLECVRRLRDTATVADIVRIAAKVCPVDENGTVTFPGGVLAAKRRRVELSAHVDDSIYRTLREACELPDEHDRAIGAIVDLALDTPLDVLARVYETKAVALSEVAGFMARLRLAASTRTTNDERSSDSQPDPKDTER